MDKEYTGNILDLFEKLDNVAIIHGCNCQNIMGKGLAKTLKDKYPLIWSKYRTYHNIGSFEIVGVGLNKYIINAYTQINLGKSKERKDGDSSYMRHVAIGNIFKELHNYISPDTTLLIPRIGSGLAGGNWEEIKQVILDNLKHENYIFVTLKE